MNARMKLLVSDFIKSQAKAEFSRSMWFDFGNMRVYLRAGKTISYDRTGRTVIALCVSNVEVNEDERRKGIFSDFVHMIIGLGVAHYYTEFQVENAISGEMIGFCKKHDMKVKPSEYGSVDSYWMEM